MQLRIAHIPLIGLTACLALMLSPATAQSQYKIESSHVGPGGSYEAGCETLLRGSAGQSLSGQSSSATFTVESGFWPPISGLDIELSNDIQTAQDYESITAGNTVVVSPLANDLPASGLTLQYVADPINGSVLYTPGQTTFSYTPDNGYAGLEAFSYVAGSTTGCTSTGTVVISVEAASTGDISVNYFNEQRNRRNGVAGLKRVNCLAISPDGQNIYALGRNDHSIVSFARNEVTGDLNFIEQLRNRRGGISRMRYPSDVVVSPDGNNVYSAGEYGNAIQMFSRNQLSGKLTIEEELRQGQASGTGTVRGLKRVVALAISPDGRNIYAAGKSENALSVFQRQSSNGTISFVEYFKDGQGGVDGLRCAFDVKVSPDGKHVYACGLKDNAVAVFARDPFDGRLTFVERLKNGSGNVVNMKSPVALSISPSGRHVYVASNGNDAVVAFARDEDTGELTFLRSYRSNILGMDAPSGIDISPRGTEVLISGGADNSLVVFTRSPQTGTLEYKETRFDGKEGVDGLRGARCVLIEQYSEHFYCAGQFDNAISQFQINQAPVAVDDDNSYIVFESDDQDILVLNNDSDPDGDPLTVSATTNGSLGTVTIVGSGSRVNYAAGSSIGHDAFTYTISDGKGGTSTATVTVRIVADTRSKLGVAQVTDPAAFGDFARISATPNPFIDDVNISLEMARDAELTLRVLDLSGREIVQLHQGARRSGSHSWSWHGHLPSGAELAQGVYVLSARLRYADGTEDQLMLKLLSGR